MDIIASIDRWGQLAPDRIAHSSEGRSLTYGELLHGSNALAAGLLGSIPDDGSPIMVVGHKEPEMLIAFLGAVKSGHPYIPVDTSLPGKRVAQIAEASGCAAILTPDDVSKRLSRPAKPATTLPRRDPESPHYIIFTSGSAGTPKGVIITSKNLSAFLQWMLAEQGFAGQDEVFLNQAPFSFDLSVMDLYLSLVTGGTLASITKDEASNLKRLYETLARSGTTTWVSTPSFAQLCLADASFDQEMLPRVRRFLFCGETLPPFVAAKLLERFPSAAVWNTYGPTEATVAMTSIRLDRETLARWSALPVGFPMPGVRVEIIDESGHPQPPGKSGEIVIHGDNVSAGYLGRPDLSEKAFGDRNGVRFYKTGDWGCLDSDGLLFVTGRMDGQIKLSGYRIELGDIEENLRALPNVRDAVALPVMKGGKPELLAAFVIPAARDGLADLDLMLAMRSALSNRLPVYMIPKKFVFLDGFPMTPNGKADRRKLAELL